MSGASKARVGETLASKSFLFRVASTVDGKTTVLLKTPNLQEAQATFAKRAKAARDAGTQEMVYLDKFHVEEREVWAQRYNWSQPVKPLSIRFSARKTGKLRILYVPLEIPVWTGARGWAYIANLAYARAFADLGHEVTVLNTEAIRYRELVSASKWDQVWTHVHFRHATDHYYREWLADAAPVRVGLAGETVFYGADEALASPWYREQTRAFHDWRPFLTHCALVAPSDVPKSAGMGIPSTVWRQSVPRSLVRPVNERPRVPHGIFVGAAYPPRDGWVFHPALKSLLAKPVHPEGKWLGPAFNRSHGYLHGWMNSVGSFPELALKLYHARVGQLRYRAEKAFIGAIGQGSCVIHLPSMVKGYSSRVFEGAAAGRPVVSWQVPGEDDVFEIGTEILQYEDSPEALAEMIRRVQREPAWANEIARRARARLLADHTTEKRTADLVRWVTDG